MKLLFATRNAHKLKELQELVAPLGIEVCSPADVGGLPEVEEDTGTLAGNAEKKARAAQAKTGLASLADDSGLEVDALSGRPGVHSARFAGAAHDDAANNAKLLAELDGVPDAWRTARFRCVLALVDEQGALSLAEGTCEGKIAHAPRGEHGFGYDPLFVVAKGPHTLAELVAEEKHQVSHRGQAMRALAKVLATRR
jgi:XTP/dITP diphosphohydrolase